MVKEGDNRKEMEAIMGKNTDDDDNVVGGIVEKVPNFITAIIAIGGLIAAYFMTVGDFKIKDMELQQRVGYLEQKVDRIESNITNMQNKLEQRIPSVDAERQQLKAEVENVKEVLRQTRQLLLQKTH